MEPVPAALLLPQELQEQRLCDTVEKSGEARRREGFGSVEAPALPGTYLVL